MHKLRQVVTSFLSDIAVMQYPRSKLELTVKTPYIIRRQLTLWKSWEKIAAAAVAANLQFHL